MDCEKMYYSLRQKLKLASKKKYKKIYIRCNLHGKKWLGIENVFSLLAKQLTKLDFDKRSIRLRLF